MNRIEYLIKRGRERADHSVARIEFLRSPNLELY